MKLVFNQGSFQIYVFKILIIYISTVIIYHNNYLANFYANRYMIINILYQFILHNQVNIFICDIH